MPFSMLFLMFCYYNFGIISIDCQCKVASCNCKESQGKRKYHIFYGSILSLWLSKRTFKDHYLRYRYNEYLLFCKII
jgi:hypothetical protein